MCANVCFTAIRGQLKTDLAYQGEERLPCQFKYCLGKGIGLLIFWNFPFDIPLSAFLSQSRTKDNLPREMTIVFNLCTPCIPPSVITV